MPPSRSYFDQNEKVILVFLSYKVLMFVNVYLFSPEAKRNQLSIRKIKISSNLGVGINSAKVRNLCNLFFLSLSFLRIETCFLLCQII